MDKDLILNFNIVLICLQGSYLKNYNFLTFIIDLGYGEQNRTICVLSHTFGVNMWAISHNL